MVRRENAATPPFGSAAGALGLRQWQKSAFPSPPLQTISPSNKPALNRQRDHSACQKQDTPLKIKKTRENLRHDAYYHDIPPTCLHTLPRADSYCANSTSDGLAPSVTSLAADLDQTGTGDAAASTAETTNSADIPSSVDAVHLSPLNSDSAQKYRSVSRRMLSKVRQGILDRSRSQSIRLTESEPSLIRRISSRRKPRHADSRRVQSYELDRDTLGHLRPSHVEGSPETTLTSTKSFSTATDSMLESTESNEPFVSEQNVHPIESLLASERPCSPQAVTTAASHKAYKSRLTSRAYGLRNGDDVPRALQVPCVELSVLCERGTLEPTAEQDIWVAIEVVVRTKAISGVDGDSYPGVSRTAPPQDPASCPVIGYITSLRLCFKPAGACSLLEVIGQRALKNAHPGDRCAIFAKIHVPAVEYEPHDTAGTSDAMFVELEGMMGILESELLHVEARFRHSLFPRDNIGTVRQVATLKRPKPQSRWTMLDAEQTNEASASIQVALASHFADKYPADRALRLISRYLGPARAKLNDVRDICRRLESILVQTDAQDLTRNPTVTVTNLDIDSSAGLTSVAETHDAHMFAVIAELEASHVEVNGQTPVKNVPATSSLSAKLSPSAPILTPNTPKSSFAQAPSTQSDSARTVWRHIRHSSLSVQDFGTLAVEGLQQLEAGDDTLRTLRKQALANKRSVGVETLKGWKWDDMLSNRGEAPWL